MAVTVSGILRDSGGNPAANDVIKFYTKQGFNGALPSATLEVTTSVTGAYDFELSVGVHLLSVQYNDVLTKVGKVTVTSDMPSPQTLDSLLAFEEPLLPDEIIIVQGLVAEANEDANRAEAAATSVEGIEDEVESDRAEVAANAQQVADDKQAVAFAAAQVDQDKNDVTSMTAQVTSMRDEVESDRAEVSANAVDVNAKAIQVTNDAQDAAESSLLSQMWAVGNNPSNGTPSDTNNAEYWSNRAYQLATGALKYGNQFTPTPGTPYPPVTESDTMYMVNFSDPNGSFTYTDGDLAGTTVINGNAIIYNVQQSGNKYEAQSYVFTGVATVNGKSPDGANNVDITASDVGAYSKGEVDTALGGKANADDVYTKTESDIRYLRWDLMVGFRFRDSLYGFDRTAIALKGDGTELLRSDFPKLWSVASGIAVSQSLIDADPETYAASYGDGDGSTTFTMPNYGLMPWDAAAGAYGAAGTTAEDQMVNITGTLPSGGYPSGTDIPTGVFDYTSGFKRGTNQATIDSTIGGFDFDASRQVNTGDHVRPKTNFSDVWIIHGEIA